MVRQFPLLNYSFTKLKYASPSLPLMSAELTPTQVPHGLLLSVCREPCKELEVVACHVHSSLLLFGLSLLLGVLFSKLGTRAFLANGQPRVKNSGQRVRQPGKRRPLCRLLHTRGRHSHCRHPAQPYPTALRMGLHLSSSQKLFRCWSLCQKYTVAC